MSSSSLVSTTAPDCGHQFGSAESDIMGGMDVELLVVQDCPHEGAAAARLREALDDVGLVATRFRTTVIDTLNQAEERGFVGSPTVLINGRDPFLAPGVQPAVACRRYSGVSGAVGVPPLRELRQALKRAADISTSTAGS